MSTINIKLYDIFRKDLKLEEDRAREAVEAIEQVFHATDRDNATKDFVKATVSDAKNDLIKWMFAFWIGQIAVIAGILMYFLRK